MKWKKYVFEVIVLIIIAAILRAFLYFKLLSLDTLVVCGIALCMTKIMTREIYDGK